MARYVDAVDLPLAPAAAFDYLADFSRTAEWDPGVVEAERVGAGPVGLGSRFRVTVGLLGRQLLFEYEVVAYERPTRLVLEGSDGSVRSIDEITFAPCPTGSRVTYEARLELQGIRRLADPLLGLLLQQIGRVAMRGLRERLQNEGPASGDTESRDAACGEVRPERSRAGLAAGRRSRPGGARR